MSSASQLLFGSIQGSTEVFQEPLGWTPAKLFENNEKGVWYNIQDQSTLYQDIGKLSPVTSDGQAVRAIEDSSGNGYDGIIETTTKPIFRTQDGLNWLEFPENNTSFFEFSGLSDLQLESVLLSCRFSASERTSGMNLFSGEETSLANYRLFIRDTDSNNSLGYRPIRGSGNIVNWSGNLLQTNQDYVVLGNIENSGDFYLRVDGVEVDRSSRAPGSTERWVYLGSSPSITGPTSQFRGRMYEVVISQNVSLENIIKLENYLGNL